MAEAMPFPEFAGEGARATLPKDAVCRGPSLGVLGFARDSSASG
jgi:hypothetical protein